MTTSWQEQLAHIRARAAANCGLTAYPAELIRISEKLANPSIALAKLPPGAVRPDAAPPYPAASKNQKGPAMRGPFETKVAAASAVPLVVGAFFGAASFYHWFTPPPLALQATIVTLLTAAAGWLAPHTSRPRVLSAAETAALDDMLAKVAVSPVTQPTPPVTTTP